MNGRLQLSSILICICSASVQIDSDKYVNGTNNFSSIFFPLEIFLFFLKKKKESSSIILFGSFLRKEGAGFGGVWRGFNYL